MVAYVPFSTMGLDHFTYNAGSSNHKGRQPR
jgi:hypothetical protein